MSYIHSLSRQKASYSRHQMTLKIFENMPSDISVKMHLY